MQLPGVGHSTWKFYVSCKKLGFRFRNLKFVQTFLQRKSCGHMPTKGLYCSSSSRHWTEVWIIVSPYILRCGGKTVECDDHDHKCFSALLQKYKFYLAIENSRCQEYITEKFSRSIINFMVNQLLFHSVLVECTHFHNFNTGTNPGKFQVFSRKCWEEYLKNA